MQQVLTFFTGNVLDVFPATIVVDGPQRVVVVYWP